MGEIVVQSESKLGTSRLWVLCLSNKCTPAPNINPFLVLVVIPENLLFYVPRKITGESENEIVLCNCKNGMAAILEGHVVFLSCCITCSLWVKSLSVSWPLLLWIFVSKAVYFLKKDLLLKYRNVYFFFLFLFFKF